MADADALWALLERVKAASGPDREIDQDLFCDLSLCPRGEDGLLDAYRAPHYTKSLDAAVALVERVLPGWAWSCGTCVVSNDGWVKPDAEGPDKHLCDVFDDGFFGDAKGGNVPLSLLEAMLCGLIAKAEVSYGG